mmetsp:Transcript_99997/g.282295  ORF Transcript_99997/g.282295 Transcript_99997/m.282295 type:complete len:260 (+) Transcript_99997:1868-2647(+)
MSASLYSFFQEKKVMQVPFLPARPVLPDLWTYVSTFGGSHWITSRMSGTSSPRAATSVATRMSNCPSRKPAIVTSRCFCSMEPCNTWLLPEKPELNANSLASCLVSAKMIVLIPGPPYTASTSLKVAARCFQTRHLTARCVTSAFVCCRSLPTTSITMWSRIYFDATAWTHSGTVALQSNFWIDSGFWCCELAASSTFSMSSWKPMSSISSASSSTTWLRPDNFKFPRSMWSMTRPGVPTTTSTPRLSAPSWGPYIAPP